MKHIVVIGGAGDMARVAAGRLLSLVDDCRILLADRDLAKAERRAQRLGPAVSAVRVDIFDESGLREVIRGHDLTINATGPYNRTGRPVLEACIDEGVDYIDFGDEDVAAEQLLALDEAAREAGITAFICAGIAPGVVNLVVKKCVSQLDEVGDVEVAWVSGANSPGPGEERGGGAVIEHMLFESVGETTSLREGEPVPIPNFQRAHEVDFPKPLGRYTAYEIGHAEVVTLPRFLPAIRNLRALGAIYPPYLNGVFQGVAADVQRGVTTFDEAATALKALDAGRRPVSYRPHWAMLKGVARQLWRGELAARHVPGFVRFALTGSPGRRSLGAVRVTVEGVQDGRRVRFCAQASLEQGGAQGAGNIDEVTGGPLAVFASMMLGGEIRAKGVVAPEACVDPDAFVAAAAPLDLRGLGELMTISRQGADEDLAQRRRDSKDFSPKGAAPSGGSRATTQRREGVLA